ncbi:MAG: NADH-quinone oxidoreductase subunit NuoN [Pseudomonadota bacterium]
MDDTLAADLIAALPEIILALAAMAMLLIGVLRRAGTEAREAAHAQLIFILATVTLVAVGVFAVRSDISATAFNGLFVTDDFARFSKALILIGAAVMLALSIDYMRRRKLMQFEYPVLIVFSCLGMCMMVSANDLIALYMGLELQSLALYVIAAFRRDDVRSNEAGLKYFVLGALSSGLLLYGASLVYGFTGSTRFDVITESLSSSEDVRVGVLFGLAFVAAGLAFKISAAPFHMWTPDVYEGAPAPVTAFFATAPKVAAAALFARVVMEPFGPVTDEWRQILTFLAVASMFLGAFAGIGQTNIKRLMAYSSIGHMGYALVALAAGSVAGVEAMLVYLAIYLVMNIGVFAFILSMSVDGRQLTRIADLDGLAQTHPGRAAGLAVLMFSLAGIPPLWGFFAKYTAFFAAVEAGLAGLAVAGVVASVIAAYYYLAIIRRMYFAEPRETLERVGGFEHRFAFGLAAIVMVVAAAPVINGFGAQEAAARAAEALAR